MGGAYHGELFGKNSINKKTKNELAEIREKVHTINTKYNLSLVQTFEYAPRDYMTSESHFQDST